MSAPLKILSWRSWRGIKQVGEFQNGSGVMGVFRVPAKTLDQDYLRKWAAELGVSDLLNEALSGN